MHRRCLKGFIRMTAQSTSLFHTDWGHVTHYLGAIYTNPIKRIVGENISGESFSALAVAELFQHTCCSYQRILQMTSHNVTVLKTYQESFCVKK